MQNEDIKEFIEKETRNEIPETNSKEEIKGIPALIIDISKIFMILVLLMLASRMFVYKMPIAGSSMNPTLSDGDSVWVIKNMYIFPLEYNRGDIVILDSVEHKNTLIKRIIGVEGDHIYITDNGKLYINGELQYEEYIKDQFWYNETTYDVVVPENCVFVLGDNREKSADSRDYGCFEIGDIVGKVFDY